MAFPQNICMYVKCGIQYTLRDSEIKVDVSRRPDGTKPSHSNSETGLPGEKKI